MKETIPADYSQRIRQLRQRFGLTQTGMAELMGVSFASVNRWENGQNKPSLLAWKQIARAEVLGVSALSKDFSPQINPPYAVSESKAEYTTQSDHPPLDFSIPAEIVRVVAEGERLAYGHLYNPAFASEISFIDPLPHQRMAVYEHMLPQPRLLSQPRSPRKLARTFLGEGYVRQLTEQSELTI